MWSQFKHGKLTTGNKILWKTIEIPLFLQYFRYIFLKTSGVRLHIYLYICLKPHESKHAFICEMWLFDLLFQNSKILICRGRISRSISESALDFEITSVDCTLQTEQTSEERMKK